MDETVDRIMDSVKPQILGSLRDGIELGIQMAIDTLKVSQPHVAVENQTWDSAVSVMALVKADFQSRRDDKQAGMKPQSGGMHKNTNPKESL